MIEHYRIRNGHDWADIFVSEDNAMFAANSSFGPFVHSWPYHACDSLKDFLATIGIDYFMGKTRGLSYEQFDSAETIRGLKRQLFDNRRAGDADAERARDVYNDLVSLDDDGIDNEDRFLDKVYEIDGISEAVSEELYLMMKKRPDPDCVGFWEKIWPGFLAQLAARRVMVDGDLYGTLPDAMPTAA